MCIKFQLTWILSHLCDEWLAHGAAVWLIHFDQRLHVIAIDFSQGNMEEQPGGYGWEPSNGIHVVVMLMCMALNSSPPSAAYMCQWSGLALVQIMACHLFGTKPLSKPMLGYCQLDPLGTNFSEVLIKAQNFSFMKMHLNVSSAKWWPFCPEVHELNGHSRKENLLMMTEINNYTACTTTYIVWCLITLLPVFF